MRKILLFISGWLILSGWGCHPAPKKIPAEGPISFAEFRQYFPAMLLPYKLGIDTLEKTEPDSSFIPLHVIRQFFPDSAFKEERGIRFYPKGISDDHGLYYFIIKTKGHNGSRGYLCLFNKKGDFLGRLRIGSAGGDGAGEVISAKIDRRYTVSLVYQQKEGNLPQTVTRENVYAPNPNGSFSLILTNTAEPSGTGQIINPIDTLPRKHKYSGDYRNGKLNLVSIRDGAAPGRFRFFIHFSKAKGGCGGELDGTGRLTGSGRGEYHEETGPCGIRFDFAANTVKISEIGGCGAYRGMQCLFEGTFFKKNEKKKKTKAGEKEARL